MANGRKLNEVTNVSTLASSDRIVTVRTNDGKTVQISLTDFMNTRMIGTLNTSLVILGNGVPWGQHSQFFMF